MSLITLHSNVAWAGAVRSRFVLIEAETEQQRNAAPALSLMFSLSGFVKMSQTVTVYQFSLTHL
jgi:hypothetical protein